MTFPLPVRAAVAFVCATLVAGTNAGAQVAFGAAVNPPTPALAAFAKTWSAIDDYTATADVEERTNDGKATSKRRYAYRYRKPNFASADVIDGPGRGSGAVWRGGDKIRGHMGGFFSHITRVIAIDDPRAASVRGDTIDMASFGYDLQDMLSTPGALADAGGPAATTDVTLVLARPSAGGVTKVVLELSNATHLPVGRRQYVGATLVKSERWTDVKTQTGLKAEDFGT